MTDTGSVRAGVAASRDALGEIDVLVNNAGTDRFSFFVNSDEELWDFVLGVNLRGVLAVTHAVLPKMQERRTGAIVNVASEAGRVGSQGSVVYSAAKAGVIGFTKAIAREARATACAATPSRRGRSRRRCSNAAPQVLGEIGERLQAGHGQRDCDGPRGRARGGRRRDRVPGERGRLVCHRPDAERQRRPVDVVSLPS